MFFQEYKDFLDGKVTDPNPEMMAYMRGLRYQLMQILLGDQEWLKIKPTTE